MIKPYTSMYKAITFDNGGEFAVQVKHTNYHGKREQETNFCLAP